MMSQADYDQQLAEARKRVEAMDKIDGHRDRSAGTILAAMEAGARNPDSGAQFDAIVMFTDVMGMTNIK